MVTCGILRIFSAHIAITLNATHSTAMMISVAGVRFSCAEFKARNRERAEIFTRPNPVAILAYSDLCSLSVTNRST